MSSPGSATERLSRLLAMVPYLVSRQGIPLTEAAKEIGISEVALIKDLELLFVCGTPGHMPDDLIDAEWDDGHVYLRNADTLARPLRLGVDEALALIVGLRALVEVPGLHHRDALERTMAKLEAAAGDAALTSAQVSVEVEGESEVLAAARRALAGSRRLHLTYFVPTRDETTERDVDPMRVVLMDGRWYLEGWCRRAEAVRLFRLDRVVAIEMLDVPADVPSEATARDLDAGLFVASPEDIVVVLELDPPAHWVADYYPVESVEDLPDGRLIVRLRAADTRWLRSLVLRLAGAARVLDPPELREAVRTRASDALAAYR
ncbi:MAG: proteasome accessory factor [Actinomycetota bacterium]|nr:proteasome accessory factor [Actinomycetota bacterium]MDQ1666436.1 proteasome accessory factor [Actinomycetota bacterium]MDQ1668520.1 proteasome accessory factor [Actinomycetota bacterium]